MKDKQKHPASVAMIALRESLDMTQAQFAVLVMNSSVTSVARWETTHPPADDLLLRLADMAEEKHRPDLADAFLKVFMKDVRKFVPRSVIARWVAANG